MVPLLRRRGHVPAERSLTIRPVSSTVARAGDAASGVPRAAAGVFTLDRAETLRSFGKLAEIDANVACVGHGEPIAGPRTRLEAVAAALPP